MKTLGIISIACLLILPIISVLSFSSVVSATPENWSEVVRFTGSGTTAYFTCSHVEWRIRWSYVPDPSYPQYAVFSVLTYPQGEDTLFIDYIMKTGDSETSGISYIHNQQGTFYCKISEANTQSFVVIIEQDVDSIPEFQSFLILPLFMIATLLTALVCKRKKQELSRATFAF